MNGPTVPTDGLPFDPSRPLVRLYAVIPAATGWECPVYGPTGRIAHTRAVSAFALMSDGATSWLEPLYASNVIRCHD